MSGELVEAVVLALAMAGPQPEVEHVVTLTLQLWGGDLSLSVIQEIRGAVKGVLEAIDREPECRYLTDGGSQ